LFHPHAFAALNLSNDSYGADDFGSDQDPEPQDGDGSVDHLDDDEQHQQQHGGFQQQDGEEGVSYEEEIDEEVEEDPMMESDGSFQVDGGDDDGEPQFNARPFGQASFARLQQQRQQQVNISSALNVS
jgi:hypothetical protein